MAAVNDGSLTMEELDSCVDYLLDAVLTLQENRRLQKTRFIYGRLTDIKKKSEEKGKPDLNILFIYNMPFRALAKMTAGAVSMEMVDGIVEAVNGNFMKGMKKILGGFFRNKKANKEFEKKLYRQKGDSGN